VFLVDHCKCSAARMSAFLSRLPFCTRTPWKRRCVAPHIGSREFSSNCLQANCLRIALLFACRETLKVSLSHLHPNDKCASGGDFQCRHAQSYGALCAQSRCDFAITRY